MTYYQLHGEDGFVGYAPTIEGLLLGVVIERQMGETPLSSVWLGSSHTEASSRAWLLEPVLTAIQEMTETALQELGSDSEDPEDVEIRRDVERALEGHPALDRELLTVGEAEERLNHAAVALENIARREQGLDPLQLPVVNSPRDMPSRRDGPHRHHIEAALRRATGL